MTGLTAAAAATLFQQLWSGRAMNRAIDSAATEQTCVSGVHNRIDIEFGDIAAEDVDLVVASFHGASRSIDQEPLDCNV